jgi:thymidylate synthase ThyX
MTDKSTARKIYVLKGRPEEDIAMAMAMSSRSPESFKKNLAGINEARSSGFLEKFYITYGHGSIADTAFIHLALENISNIATKAVENTRLAAFQEKSTRYQIIDREHVYYPKNILNSPYKKDYRRLIDLLFDTYDEMVRKMMDLVKQEVPQKTGENKLAYEHRIRIQVIDQCRYLLPAATLANVGATFSGRSIEYTIAKLRSHPLREIQEIGKELRTVVLRELPTLVKFADESEYIINTEESMRRLTNRLVGRKNNNDPRNKDVRLVSYDKDALEKIASSILIRYSGLPWLEIEKRLKKMSRKEKISIIDRSIAGRHGRHDKPLREFENTYYLFDIVCDYGAYRDLQRHRILTQTSQLLTTDLGYCQPTRIKEIDFEEKFGFVMDQAAKVYKKIARVMPLEAQYVVPFAYKKRTLFGMNLRELIYLIELRSQPTGHISYRRIVQEMWRQVNRIHPYFTKHIMVNMS